MTVTVTLRFHEIVIDGKAVLLPQDEATSAALASLVPEAKPVFPIKRRGPGRPPKAKTAPVAKRGPGRPPKKK
jgi:hypothetical protein